MGLRDWLSELLRGPVPEPSFTTCSRTLELVLPSDRRNVSFRARITVSWRLPEGTAVPDETLVSVCDQLVAAARDVTRSFSVLHREEAESALDMELRRFRTHAGTHHAQATLAVDSEDVEFARQARARDLEVMRQQAEVERLATFRDTVLRDAHTARLWWLGTDPNRLIDLAKHADDIERAVALIAPPSGTGAQRPGEAAIAELINLFLTGLDPDSRWFLIHQLSRVFCNYDRNDLALQLSTAITDDTLSATPDDTGGNGASPTKS
ncbi:hypothetical protein [Microbispora rosea]